MLRRGFDWITGPQLQYKRDTEVGFFREPRFFVAEANARGDAKEIRFTGPDHYEATDASYTTCVAPHPDWYLRGEELEVDNLRKVGTARRVSVHFLDVPVLYAPWLQFPLSNERKSGFLTPTLGSTGVRGFEATAPYYLNLAPNYDATITPRLMTKRGLQIGGAVPLPARRRDVDVRRGGRRDERRVPAARSRRPARTATRSRGSTTSSSRRGSAASSTSTRCPTTSTSPTSPTASRSRRRRRCRAKRVSLATFGPVVAARARAELPDAAGSRTHPSCRRTTACRRSSASLNETDWLGLTWSGVGEYARFSQDQLAPTGERFVLYPTAAWTPAGRGVVLHRARRRAHARVHARPHDGRRCRSAIRATRFRSRASTPGSCSSATCRCSTRRSRRRSSRARSTSTSRSRTRPTAPVFDTALDDFNFSQLFAENRYIGNDRIGDANQLTLALTSRFLDRDTGAERLRLAVGQRFYFQDQRVSLNEPPRSASTSDFLVGGRRPALRGVVARQPAAVQPRFARRRAPQRGRSLYAGARTRAERDLALHARARRPDRRPSSRSSRSTCPANGRSAIAGRCSGAGTTR